MTGMVLALLVAIVAGPQAGAGSGVTYVVFVCEDGADESLIAAAYFNKLAAERGLAALAAFRGVDPENELSMRAVAGLKEDGVPIPSACPRTSPRPTWRRPRTSSRLAARSRRTPPSRARPPPGTTCRTTGGTGRCGTRSCAMCAR